MSMLRAAIKDEALGAAISASDDIQEERHRVAKEQLRALSNEIKGMRELITKVVNQAPQSQGLALLVCILTGVAIGYFLS